MTDAREDTRPARIDAAAARRLLVGRDAPFEPDKGVVAIQALADAGDADALCTLATLRGAGAWTSHSWPEAMDLLQQAAELGSVDARSQLLLLSPDSELVVGVRSGAIRHDGRWGDLKQTINLEECVRPTPPVQVFDSPRIWVVERFATPEVCDWLVGRARDRFKRALMRDTTTGVASALDNRTCSDFIFDVLDGAIVLLLLRIKISHTTSIPIPHMEPPQIFHYAIGQEIKPHHDFLSDGKSAYGADGSYTGDRLATFLMYLNDGYEGGDLEFPLAGYRYKGRTGDAIFFANQRDKKQDPNTLHRAEPIRRGEKFMFSQWIHDRPFAA